jgi:type VII secretion protein EccB
MPTRRDQIQSWQFHMQRVISAFVTRDPDPAETPFRRLGGAGLGGVMAAIIALAAVGVFGFIFPGGATSWKDGRSVIQEKGTGAIYVYRNGRLHPVENYASALLVLGNNAPTKMVSPNSLVGTPRGNRIGIPGAPAALPPAKRMLRGAWTLCSQPARDNTGRQVALTALTVGRPPAGGREMGDEGVLARDSKSNQLYLVWHDRRYEINDEKVVLEGLVMTSEPTVSIGSAWLNALPAGQKIGILRPNGRGTNSTVVSGAVIGQIYQVSSQGGGKQFYLVDGNTLVSITPFQASIQLADPETRTQAYKGSQPEAKPLDASTAAQARKSEPVTGEDQPPVNRPNIARVTEDRPAICAAYAPGANEPTVLLEAVIPPVTGAVPTTQQTDEGTPLADRILIEPGYGALVEFIPSPGAQGAGINLVTDLGFRYPLANDDVAAMLGYGKVRRVQLPGSLIIRLPSGPPLDPAEATRSIDSD